jgi:hypothetical protein
VIQVGLFDQFKGAKTLLLWGDKAGMETLLRGISLLQNRTTEEFLLGAGNAVLAICPKASPASRSHLAQQDGQLRWECSIDKLALAEDLIDPLLEGPGHQFLDVSGLADQIIVSRDEYPSDLR